MVSCHQSSERICKKLLKKYQAFDEDAPHIHTFIQVTTKMTMGRPSTLVVFNKESFADYFTQFVTQEHFCSCFVCRESLQYFFNVPPLYMPWVFLFYSYFLGLF